MSFRNKAHLSRIGEVIGFLGTLYWLQRVFEDSISGQNPLFAMGFLLLSVGIGVTGFITVRYNAVRDETDSLSDRVAMETLSKLGQQAQKQSLRPKKQHTQH
jgi:hypothetical protein